MEGAARSDAKFCQAVRSSYLTVQLVLLSFHPYLLVSINHENAIVIFRLCMPQGRDTEYMWGVLRDIVMQNIWRKQPHTMDKSTIFPLEKKRSYGTVHRVRYIERKIPHMSRTSFLFCVTFGLDFVISNRIFTFLYGQVTVISAFFPVKKRKVSKRKTMLFILTKESR